MPFGLLNVGSTFQTVMDFSFRDLIGKIIEIFQDNLTVVSKERNAHIHRLRKVFERCRKYDQGKLLGRIVSKDGICIEPTRVESIKRIPFPDSKKSL